MRQSPPLSPVAPSPPSLLSQIITMDARPPQQNLHFLHLLLHLGINIANLMLPMN